MKRIDEKIDKYLKEKIKYNNSDYIPSHLERDIKSYAKKTYKSKEIMEIFLKGYFKGFDDGYDFCYDSNELYINTIK